MTKLVEKEETEDNISCTLKPYIQVLKATGGGKDFDEIYDNRSSIVSAGLLSKLLLAIGR